MKLIRLNVADFGTLHDLRMEFTPGVNTLCEKNGWGKSTLAVFLKAMFYGLPQNNKHSLDENERKKYQPWQGGAYGGSVEFSTSRGSFRAERFFGAKETADTFALYDLSTNLPSDAYSANLGEELFGIDSAGFERSTYLSQRLLTGKTDTAGISARLAGQLEAVGDIGDYDTAVAELEKRRKFYILTGERGAIAELERERADAQRELEILCRKEDALGAEEKKLAELNDKIEALRKTLDGNRAELKQAGLDRERNALCEQRARMLAELSDLSAKKERIASALSGDVPDDEKLAQARKLLDQIRDAKARLKAIPEALPEAAELNRLRDKYHDWVPEDESMNRLTQKCVSHRELSVKRKTLAEAGTDAAGGRFADGVPEKEKLSSTFASLEKADALTRELDGKAKSAPSGGGRIAAFACLGLGAVACVLAFLPALSGLLVPLLCAGGVLIAAGIVLLVLSVRSRKAAEDRRKKEKERDALLLIVHAFLKKYRMPEDDPRRSLAELSALARQAQEDAGAARRSAATLAQLTAQWKALGGDIRASFEIVGIRLPEKEDYTADAEQLRRESETLIRLEQEERRRAIAYATEQRELDALEERLRPFLSEYDPKQTMLAGDCIRQVSERAAEYRRLDAQIEEKTKTLTAFVAEKKLGEEPAVGTRDYDTLEREEKELNQALAEAVEQQGILRAGVSRLENEIDGIPEAEERVRRLTGQIAEYKANAQTIDRTKKFLEEAKTALSTRYLPPMQESFCNYLGILTGQGEELPEAVMDPSFEIRLRTGGQTHEMESYSRGWRDAVQFCVRLALADALSEGSEKPFLLLDDPFTNLDDERYAAARALLDRVASDYQILYFICRRERAQE